MEPEDDGVTIMDVSALTLGIETTGGIFTPIIKRNSIIPTRKSQMYVDYLGLQISADTDYSFPASRPPRTTNRR